MGSVVRLIRWAWNRWADYQSVVAIFDLLDAKTIAGGVGGFLAMMVFGATNPDWSAPTVVLAALIAGACVAVICAAIRWFRMRRPAAISAPSRQPAILREINEWKQPLDAIEAFADQALVTRKNEWSQKYEEAVVNELGKR
jgi:hypothetical protein